MFPVCFWLQDCKALVSRFSLIEIRFKSLYVDDVALFIRPKDEDLLLTKSLLQIFGEASGL